MFVHINEGGGGQKVKAYLFTRKMWTMDCLEGLVIMEMD